MTYNNKKVNGSVIYRSPSQNNYELESFLSNLRQFLIDANERKTSLSVTARDFNPRSYSWWANDFNTTKASKLFILTSSNGFS